MRVYLFVAVSTLLSAVIAPGVGAQESRAVPPPPLVDGWTPPAVFPTPPVADGDRFVPDEELRAAAEAERRLAAPARAVSSDALGATRPNEMHVPPGQVVVEVARRRLLYGVDANFVRVYPVAVGKSGAQWRGSVVVGRMSTSPGWHPTPHQRRRRHLPAYVAPGRSNPLGVRAIYLFRGGHDTLLRIHGTNEPRSIGHAVSSGCIRMRNADVLDLYSRVHVGTLVTAR